MSQFFVLVTKKNYFSIQLYAIVLYVHFIVGAGVPNVRIMGGSAASAGEFPSMVRFILTFRNYSIE